MKNKEELSRSLDHLQRSPVAIRPNSRERVILVVGESLQPLRTLFGQLRRRLPISR
jgi:hypothetical protein